VSKKLDTVTLRSLEVDFMHGEITRFTVGVGSRYKDGYVYPILTGSQIRGFSDVHSSYAWEGIVNGHRMEIIMGSCYQMRYHLGLDDLERSYLTVSKKLDTVTLRSLEVDFMHGEITRFTVGVGKPRPCPTAACPRGQRILETMRDMGLNEDRAQLILKDIYSGEISTQALETGLIDDDLNDIIEDSLDEQDEEDEGDPDEGPPWLEAASGRAKEEVKDTLPRVDKVPVVTKLHMEEIGYLVEASPDKDEFDPEGPDEAIYEESSSETHHTVKSSGQLSTMASLTLDSPSEYIPSEGITGDISASTESGKSLAAYGGRDKVPPDLEEQGSFYGEDSPRLGGFGHLIMNHKPEIIDPGESSNKVKDMRVGYTARDVLNESVLDRSRRAAESIHLVDSRRRTRLSKKLGEGGRYLYPP